MITKRIIALEGDTVKTLKPYPEKLGERAPLDVCWFVSLSAIRLSVSTKRLQILY